MKIKTAEKILWGSTALLALLRVLQYIFVIAEDGFFIKDTLWQSILSNALYVAMAVFVLLSFVLRLTKGNGYKSKGTIVCAPLIRALSLLNAVILAAFGVILLVCMDWLGAVALAAAVYFLLLYFYASGRAMAIMHFTAIFALAYPCVRVIKMFFATFKEIKVSENIIDMVAMCTMILAMLALIKLCMGFEESMAKAGWSFWLFGGIGVLGGACKLFGLLWTGNFALVDIAASVSDLAVWALMLAVYHSCAAFVPVAEPQPEESEPVGTEAD